MQQNSFSGKKVIELASVLAGPSVGQFFSELGAEVIKVENPDTNGDVTRSWKLKNEDGNSSISAYYSSINSNKKIVFANAKTKEGYRKIVALLKEADFVICNFKYGDAVKLKLDFTTVKKINPSVIYGEITGFGSSPRTAYDVVLQAETGFITMNGEKDSFAKLPVAFIDLFAAHQLKEGLLIAYINSLETKKPLKVSVSLFDSALASLANQASNFLNVGHIPKPLGNIHPNIAPYGECFPCKDNKVVILAIGNNKQFESLCELIGAGALATDKTFLNNQNRVKNRKKLEKEIAPYFLLKNREDWMKLFISKNVPTGAVRNMKEVFDLNEAKQRTFSATIEGKQVKAVLSNCFTISND